MSEIKLQRLLSGLMTDDEAREWLEYLLDLRRRAEAGQTLGQQWPAVAGVVGSGVLRCLLAWVGRELKLVVPAEDYAGLPVERAREMMVSSLRRGLPIFQREASDQLADAIEALSSGFTAPVLQTKSVRRGRNPHLSAQAELDILRWKAWQRGLGRKLGEIQSDVIRGMEHNGEIDPTRKWRESLEKVFGKEWVRSQLELAEKIGICEAKGMSLEEMLDGADDAHELFQAWVRVPRDLAPLVKARVRAMAKRRIP